MTITTNPELTSDPWTLANLNEVQRLIEELSERMHTHQHLAAISSVQAIIGRSNDLAEHCSQRFAADLADLAVEDPTGYL